MLPSEETLFLLMLEKGCKITEEIKKRCLSSFELKLYQFLYPNHLAFSIGDDLMDEVCENGNLELAKWLRSPAKPGLDADASCQGCPWGLGRWWTCIYAAKGGHLKVLQWARSQGCPWNVYTCRFAAEGGHLEVLQWARSDPTDPCPWDELVCINAALKGHLEVLKWAIEKGCPYYINAVKHFALNYPLILEYLSTL